ncbi:hypothetical protein BG006_005504 [Podila minutissima]|uniref:Uncharacterized protein n=1 Tax=Podila minutissima TaxID=64525 RepID=A0A9P5SWW6_9FUNG|nr:hypothetical protein BG006_005504 [Podila minutissima]
MTTSLSPACIASNHKHVYYLSRESYGWLVLVKSERFPRSFATDAWSIVSMVEPDQLNRLVYPDMRYFQDIDCSVDDDGVFSFRSRRDNFAYHYRYDPRERFVPSQSHCNPPNSVGDWTRQSLDETDEVAYRKKIVIQPPIIGAASNRTGDSMMIYYPHTQEQLPLKGPPTIQLGYFNTTEPSYIRSRDLVHVSLAQTNGAVYNVVYGDGYIYTIIKSGTPIPVPGSDAVTYNKTLTYFPFQDPFNMTSPPASTVTIAWNVDCHDDKYDDEAGTAVANGKFYYFCEPRGATSNDRISYLYIHDRKTATTQGPIRFGGFHRAPMLLVHGADPQSDPPLAVVQGYANRLDLLNLTDVSAARYSEHMFGAPHFQTVYEVCPRSMSQATENAIIGGSVGGVVVIAIAAFFLIRKRRRQAARSDSIGLASRSLPPHKA